jgi:hypothetical protein
MRKMPYVFADGELEETATAKDFLVVQAEGKRQVRRNLKHYLGAGRKPTDAR